MDGIRGDSDVDYDDGDSSVGAKDEDFGSDDDEVESLLRPPQPFPETLQGLKTDLFHTEPKVINCPIHSSMEFHPCLMTVIDTPQFQRLRKLRQLGAASWVFPAAGHSRFEHSLGVSYLATKLVKTLRERQPELNITQLDILCVGLAGLCHDLGHGPFSHLFDGEFIQGRDWTHEHGSVYMLRHLLVDNGIDLCSLYGLSKSDMLFIEELILGKQIKGGLEARKGRGPDKFFLYDIINNERSGFDVDKLDYILRDSNHTGVHITTGVNVDRIAQMAKVLPDENGTLTISFPEKAVFSLFGVFHARAWLHYTVYQHKVVKACEFMIRDILKLANPILKFKSPKTGKRLTMADSIEDMSVYEKLSDAVLDLIEFSEDPGLAPAQALILRLKKRDLYRCCGTVAYPHVVTKKEMRSIEDRIVKQLAQITRQDGRPVPEDDIIAEIMVVHHGKGQQNPVDGLRFYTKARNRAPPGETLAGMNARAGLSMIELESPSNTQSSFSSTISAGGTRCFKLSRERYGGALLPQHMGVNSVRVFAKTLNTRDALAKALRKWSREQRLASPLCHNSQVDQGPGDDMMNSSHNQDNRNNANVVVMSNGASNDRSFLETLES